MDNSIKLINGDCLEVMETMIKNNKKVDLIVTDPPYELDNHGGGKTELAQRKLVKEKHIDFISKGFDYIKCFELMLKLCKIPNILIFCSNKQVSKTMKFFEDRKLSTTLLVWQKTNPSPLCNGKHISEIEFVVYVRGKGATFNKDTPFSYKKKVFTSPLVSSKNRIHPTQKNTEQLKQYIELHSKEHDIVFDPFAGSGTTGIACIETNRMFLGVEIDKDIYGRAINFIDNAKIEKQSSLF